MKTNNLFFISRIWRQKSTAFSISRRSPIAEEAARNRSTTSLYLIYPRRRRTLRKSRSCPHSSRTQRILPDPQPREASAPPDEKTLRNSLSPATGHTSPLFSHPENTQNLQKRRRRRSKTSRTYGSRTRTRSTHRLSHP